MSPRQKSVRSRRVAGAVIVRRRGQGARRSAPGQSAPTSTACAGDRGRAHHERRGARERWQSHGDEAAACIGAELVHRFPAHASPRCAARRRSRPICRKCSISLREEPRSRADANHRRSVLRVLARTERMVPRPAFLAASCKAWRIFVALLVDRGDHRTAATPNPTKGGLGKLQACLDGLRHGIGGAERIKVAGVIGHPRARETMRISGRSARTARRRRRRSGRGMDGDDDAGRVARPASLEEFRIAGIAIKTSWAVAAVAASRWARRDPRRYSGCRVP